MPSRVRFRFGGEGERPLSGEHGGAAHAQCGQLAGVRDLAVGRVPVGPCPGRASGVVVADRIERVVSGEPVERGGDGADGVGRIGQCRVVRVPDAVVVRRVQVERVQGEEQAHLVSARMLAGPAHPDFGRQVGERGGEQDAAPLPVVRRPGGRDHGDRRAWQAGDERRVGPRLLPPAGVRQLFEVGAGERRVAAPVWAVVENRIHDPRLCAASGQRSGSAQTAAGGTLPGPRPGWSAGHCFPSGVCRHWANARAFCSSFARRIWSARGMHHVRGVSLPASVAPHGSGRAPPPVVPAGSDGISPSAWACR